MPDLDTCIACLIRLVLATVCGAAVGWEREFHHKGAGLRTHMLICTGACLFSLVALQMRHDFRDADIMRLVQGLLLAIGFIAGGVIFTRRGSVSGLTTAAGLWVITGVGLAIGLGYYFFAIMGTAFALIIIAGLKRMESWLHAKPEAVEFLEGLAPTQRTPRDASESETPKDT